MVHSLEHAHIWGLFSIVTTVLILAKFGVFDRLDGQALGVFLGTLVPSLVTITIEALKHIGKDHEVRGVPGSP